jgi:hypothetical protein
MYREFAGVRLGSDRDASPGIGQSTDPLPVQRRDRGNPFGPNAQARSDTPVQSGQSFPTFPAQVKVEKVHKGNFASWKVRIKAAAIQGKCIRAFEENRSGFDEDSVAYNLLFSSTPETWHVTLSEEGSAHHALHYVLDQFDGGRNEFYVDELDRDLHSLKMGKTETVEDYVMRSANLASNLKSNGRPVTHASLVDKIVNGLTEMYDPAKPGMRICGRSMILRDLSSLIKHEGYNLELTQPKVKALVTSLPERGGYKGKGQPRKFLGSCWNCGEPGHSHTYCEQPDSKFAFRPPRGNGGAEAREAPRAPISE